MIDKAKTYTTTHGRTVEIYKTDAGGVYPVHAAWQDETGMWNHQCYTASGRLNHGEDGVLDLVEVKELRVVDVWLNLDADGAMQLRTNRHAAEQTAFPDRIACLHIVREYEEGEGLS